MSVPLFRPKLKQNARKLSSAAAPVPSGGALKVAKVTGFGGFSCDLKPRRQADGERPEQRLRSTAATTA
jgi:hypothetical protein